MEGAFVAGISRVSDGDAVGEADVGFNVGVAEGEFVAIVGDLVGKIVVNGVLRVERNGDMNILLNI